MLHTTKTTPFESAGAKWELVSFREIPDQVFVRMTEPGEVLPFDGRLRPVRFRPNHGKIFPCCYVKKESRSVTVSVPMAEWRDHEKEHEHEH